MARKSCNARLESNLSHILTTKKHLSITVGEVDICGLPLPLFLFDSSQGISPIKYRMLIKMDSDVMLFVAASLCDCLKVCHHKTSDTLRLTLYQIIKKLPKI